jgi:hypothetical protein
MRNRVRKVGGWRGNVSVWLPRKFGKGRRNEDAKILHSVFRCRETEENEIFDL